MLDRFFSICIALLITKYFTFLISGNKLQEDVVILSDPN